MRKPLDELGETAARVRDASESLRNPTIKEPIDRLEAAAEGVGRSASGSWIGNQALVYYAGFQPRPAGALFSQEWGFMAVFAPGTRGDWDQFTRDEVRAEIFRRAGDAIDLAAIRHATDEVRTELDRSRQDVRSILLAVGSQDETYLAECLTRADAVVAPRPDQIIQAWSPDRIATRDSASASQGIVAPPHLELLAEVVAVRAAETACGDLARVATEAAAHIERKGRISVAPERRVGRVFIGHGNSPIWRELKDFIGDQLQLPWDEFNRVPVAGIANTSRLAQMLSSAGIALLVLTAEDEQEDGTLHARQNVIHEVGLFQGRLGFAAAIVLLEEGCEEFSNISGLGQIRFPRGNIRAAFEDVRQVLVREGLLESGTPPPTT